MNIVCWTIKKHDGTIISLERSHGSRALQSEESAVKTSLSKAKANGPVDVRDSASEKHPPKRFKEGDLVLALAENVLDKNVGETLFPSFKGWRQTMLDGVFQESKPGSSDVLVRWHVSNTTLDVWSPSRVVFHRAPTTAAAALPPTPMSSNATGAAVQNPVRSLSSNLASNSYTPRFFCAAKYVDELRGLASTPCRILSRVVQQSRRFQ